MIELKKKWLDEIKQILNKNVPQYKAFVFGSRINRTSTQYSDLDIALVSPEKIDWRKIESLKDAFSESNLPIIVDIIDLNSVSENFRESIVNNHEVIQN